MNVLLIAKHVLVNIMNTAATEAMSRQEEFIRTVAVPAV